METELVAQISGYVQGCGFRYYTHQLLSGHPVCGYVKNIPDGRVELVLQGKREDVLTALSAVKEGRAGRIADIDCTWQGIEVPLAGFEVRF